MVYVLDRITALDYQKEKVSLTVLVNGKNAIVSIPRVIYGTILTEIMKKISIKAVIVSLSLMAYAMIGFIIGSFYNNNEFLAGYYFLGMCATIIFGIWYLLETIATCTYYACKYSLTEHVSVTHMTKKSRIVSFILPTVNRKREFIYVGEDARGKEYLFKSPRKLNISSKAKLYEMDNLPIKVVGMIPVYDVNYEEMELVSTSWL